MTKLRSICTVQKCIGPIPSFASTILVQYKYLYLLRFSCSTRTVRRTSRPVPCILSVRTIRVRRTWYVPVPVHYGRTSIIPVQVCTAHARRMQVLVRRTLPWYICRVLAPYLLCMPKNPEHSDRSGVARTTQFVLLFWVY